VNRAELIQRIAAHEAAAKALRDALAAEARAELEENHTAPSWTLGDGSRVSVSTSTGGAVVTDEEAFIDWARAVYPLELVERTVVSFRNDSFRKRVITELAEQCRVNGWELPSFLTSTPAGVYRSTSITIAPETKRRMEESARTYALAGESMPELETS
jgi:glutamate/tyrosine decarboxylase-like PLP-dependent enzyme